MHKILRALRSRACTESGRPQLAPWQDCQSAGV